MDNASVIRELDSMLEKLDSELSDSYARIAMLEKSGKELIDYIGVLTLNKKPPSKSQKEQVIKAIQIIWDIS
jgi:hypothetical protein